VRGDLTPPRRCSWKLNFPTLGRAVSMTLRTWIVSIDPLCLPFGDFWKRSHLHSFCYNLQVLLARSRDVIELVQAYLWTAMVTAKDHNVVSCHFEVL
jgi:hypothetical protein